MSYLENVCCLCLNYSNEMFHYLFNDGKENMSFYEKLTTSLPQLVFNKNYDDYMLCAECCNSIKSVYEFSIRCIKNLNTFLDYKGKLSLSNSESCELKVKTVDKEENVVNYKKCIEQEENTKQKIEVMVHKDISENQVTLRLNDVNLVQFEEEDVCTQDLVNFESYNDVRKKIELSQDIGTELRVKQCDQDAKIKIEKNRKAKSLDYEFIAFDDVLALCEVVEDGSTAQIQLGEDSSSKHGAVEIKKNTIKYKLGHSGNLHHADITNEDNANTTSFVNQTSTSTEPAVNNLQIHQHSTSEQEGPNQSSSPTEPVHSSYPCNLCDKKFHTSRSLARHKITHTNLKPYVCEFCNKTFSQSNYLTAHKTIHTGQRPHVCDICQKGFSRSSNLIAHKLIHAGQKPYVCDICQKGYMHSSSLVAHKRTHAGQKSYVCNICQKSFSQASHVVRHKIIHTGQRPYVCDICEKGFNQSSSLASHKLIHTGQNPYVCDICTKSFRHLTSLTMHRRVHTGQKPYVCALCNRGFTQAAHLVRHKIIHTGRKS